MSLKPCVWCGKLISDKALSCPNCHNSEPFDQQKRVDAEERARVDRALATAQQTQYACPDCGFRRSFREILENRACPHCGNPDSRPRCGKCERAATAFDLRQGSPVCDHHLIEICDECKLEIVDGDKVIYRGSPGSYARTGTSRSVYHRICSREYRQQRERTLKRVAWLLFWFVVVVGLLLKCSTS